MIGLGLDGYEPDSGHEAALAFRIQVVDDEQFIPRHQHRKGQLILALHGALTCEVDKTPCGWCRRCMRFGFQACFHTAIAQRQGHRCAFCS